MAAMSRDLFIVKTDSPAAGRGVLVTTSWDEAVVDIRAKLDRGPVRVEKGHRMGNDEWWASMDDDERDATRASAITGSGDDYSYLDGS